MIKKYTNTKTAYDKYNDMPGRVSRGNSVQEAKGKILDATKVLA